MILVENLFNKRYQTEKDEQEAMRKKYASSVLDRIRWQYTLKKLYERIGKKKR